MKLFGEHAVGRADLRERAAAVEAERGVMIGNRTLQADNLLRDGVHVSFIDGRSIFAGRQELRAFEQTAEIFFTGNDLRAGLAGEAGVGFVFHFQTFEADDADKLSVFFPDLGLGEFHGGDSGKRKRIPRALSTAGWSGMGSLSLLFIRRDNNLQPYFFFAPFLAAAFFGAGLLALDLTAFLAIVLF